ncbi:MAG: transglycosylase domain-containing protein, partial [Actinocatenispora sp.]
AAVGSARVGRASVRAGGPDDDPFLPGGPPRSRAEERRRAMAAANTPQVRKKRKRRRRIIAGIAVLLLLVGIGTVGGTFYFTTVKLPEQLPAPQVSNIYFSDGKTLMARLGTQNRTMVDISKVPKPVRSAVVSAEDRSFYDNSGVDFKGIVRAAWGHVTGNEDAGGASTITMQYAKAVLDPSQTHRSPTEKVKEAVAAMKLNQKYSKDKILEFYLNTTFFGRGAYGIQSAAQAYFGKSVSDLTPEEAGVIASAIKDPYNLDPANNLSAAQDRWKYTMGGMRTLGQYHKAVDVANYPKVSKPDANSNGASIGLDKPTGLIVRQIKHELVDNGQFDSMKEADKQLATGGYKIVTTIDKKAEDDAIRVAKNELKGQQKGLADALVSVQPGTGAVKAYYGGQRGDGWDTAGNTHQPGSSFKVYVLAAALMNGYSIKSYWNGDSAEKFTDRGGDHKVHNSEDEICNDGGKDPEGHYHCSLTGAVRKSLNTVFYYLTQQLGKDTVIRIARDCGIRTLVPTGSNGGSTDPIDLTKVSPEEAATKPGIGNEIGFGQNPVTPLDHANGLATLANGGVYTKAHFIASMTKVDSGETYSPKPEHRRVFSKEIAADIDYVLKGVATQPNQFIQPSREQANKTGTWQYNDSNWQNSHAWTVGYVPQLAAAVWVGNQEGNKPILNDRGTAMYGWDLPGSIWAKFMSAALQDMHMPAQNFPPPAYVGNKASGQFPGPAPKPSPSPTPTPSTGLPSPGSSSPPPWQTGSPSPGPSSPCPPFACPGGPGPGQGPNGQDGAAPDRQSGG